MKKGGHYIAILHFFAPFVPSRVPFESSREGEDVYPGFIIFEQTAGTLFAVYRTKARQKGTCHHVFGKVAPSFRSQKQDESNGILIIIFEAAVVEIQASQCLRFLALHQVHPSLP